VTTETASKAPDAVMLMGSTCPYCPTVLKALQSLLDSGHIETLETYNIEEHPDLARQYGVRSVPWVRIGEFELEGLRSEKELREWAEKAAGGSGLSDWLLEQLGSGRIDTTLDRVQSDANGMSALLDLFEDPDTELNIRIGISAIMEELQGSELLKANIETLGKLTQHEEARVRGDACHYLSLSHDPSVRHWIEPLLDDPDSDVREVAQDSLEILADQ
jgi:thioredoxin-like negative regulator of GroEL